MSEESVDIGNVERQITELYREASKYLEQAYYSQNKKGGMNADYLRKGQEILNTIQSMKQAEGIIEQNVEAIVSSINPSVLIQTLMAGGLTYEAAAHAASLIEASRLAWEAHLRTAATVEAAAAEGTAASAARFARAMRIARIGAGIAVVIAIIALYLIWKSNQKEKSPGRKQITNHYQNQINRNNQIKNSYGPGDRPFEFRQIPRNL